MITDKDMETAREIMQNAGKYQNENRLDKVIAAALAVQRDELTEQCKGWFNLLKQLKDSRDAFAIVEEKNAEWKEWNRINRLRAEKAEAEVAGLRSAIKSVIDQAPQDGSGFACTFCDMGGSGYSSKGDGRHDDTRDVCPIVTLQEAINRTNPGPDILASTRRDALEEAALAADRVNSPMNDIEVAHVARRIGQLIRDLKGKVHKW